jgi:undecaprenyl-diphosphatase
VRALGVALGLVALVTIAAGQLITRLLSDLWPEGTLNHWLAGQRTSPWNTISDAVSSAADTSVIVAVTAAAATVFRLVFRRWREAAFLVVAVTAQNWIFLLATVLASRERPPVPRLDPAPPTSSYPSGHTSAAVACYCGIALVIVLHTWRRPILAALWWLLGLTLAAGVASARVYRGMHHLTDVTVGLLLGLACLLVAAWVILLRPRIRASLAREPGPPA